MSADNTVEFHRRRSSWPAVDHESQRCIQTGALLLSRFEIGRRLGSGSSGEVFAAFDRRLQTEVALKAIGRLTPEALGELKTEFRAASELVHPNLVQLHELFCQDNDWFFTMDLIEGRTLPSWLERRERRADAGELRLLFGQLALALDAFHSGGTLHRDLKPSNFLIEEANSRVVLLDFGLAHPIGKNTQGKFAGTPAYMAPEQCWGGTLTQAADWYGFGVVLYEAMTGTLPNRLPSRAALKGAPEDLADLCIELMNLDSTRRPGAEEVLGRLSSSDAREALERHSVPQFATAALVGREKEMERLRVALESSVGGETRLVMVEGPSGIGKTSLVEGFLDLAAQQGVTTLCSRCRERESMSYKAVDGLVDGIIELLVGLEPSEARSLLPRWISELTRLFPALRAAEVVVQATLNAASSADESVSRLRAIDAFSQLLGRLRQRGPLVVWLDDVQWSDSESALLLEPLLGGPLRVPLVLICSTRDANNGGPVLEALALRPRFSLPEPEWIPVGPLDPEDATKLVQIILGDSAGSAAAGAASIVRDAGGHPLFTTELAHLRAQQEQGERAEPAHYTGSLTELIERRVFACQGQLAMCWS